MLSNDDLKWMYRKMLLLRESEERAIVLSKNGELPTLLGGTGEEAIAVGICAALLPDDYYAPHHRGMSNSLAKGLDPKFLYAECYGKTTGISKGKGGNMHIYDLKHNNLGEFAILGAGLPISTGVALAQKMQKTGRIVVACIGDGGSSEGVFYESLNMAGTWKLPIVYVIENNQYAMTTPVSETILVKDLSERAKGFGIPGVTIDGSDVLAVYETVQEAVERARRGDGPSIVECRVMRWYGHHSGAGDDEQMGWVYRPEGEAERAKQNDPIKKLEKYLLENSVLTEKEAEEIKNSVKQEIDEAVAFAKSSPDPKPEDALKGLFAE